MNDTIEEKHRCVLKKSRISQILNDVTTLTTFKDTSYVIITLEQLVDISTLIADKTNQLKETQGILSRQERVHDDRITSSHDDQQLESVNLIQKLTTELDQLQPYNNDTINNKQTFKIWLKSVFDLKELMTPKQD